ncbi:MAG TPA: diguanylate cyclase [Burkholderiales bacterium]|nr:diguanylate cyclase [Burkholderiales bacterium]
MSDVPDSLAITGHVEAVLRSVVAAPLPEQAERRAAEVKTKATFTQANQRSIWLIAEESQPWLVEVTAQLTFFGFHITRFDWDETPPHDASPLVVVFIPRDAGYQSAEISGIQRIGAQHPASQLFCLATPGSLTPMVALLRAGAEVIVPAEQQAHSVLAHILRLIESQKQDPYRVLVVEDSATAIAAIRRALSMHGIDNQAINGPEQLLETVAKYRPDLVLMDMYMPLCTGVEATRVLRQIPVHHALPVVYLSSETDMGKQVEALRLGGDQFITKPFNPVFLATVLKAKIERYREMLRSTQHDGLTGLLNHSAVKGRLNELLQTLKPEQDKLCVAMLDIDHFKSINDLHGHPVGDQVIRNLAWLLKARLRASDLIGRYGGEEFLVVLPGAGLDDAHTILDRIRRDFAALLHVSPGRTLQASFSGGVAAYPDHIRDSDLIEAADNALLKSKGLGRNRIERGAEKTLTS